MTTKLIQELVGLCKNRNAELGIDIKLRVVEGFSVSIVAYKNSKRIYDEFFHLKSLYQIETNAQLQAAIDKVKEL